MAGKTTLSPSVTIAEMASPCPSHSLRGRATTLRPELIQQMKMADKKENEQSPSELPAPVDSNADSPKTAKDAKVEGQIEQFPAFGVQRQTSTHKHKSLSEAEVLAQVFVDEDRNAAIDRLKSKSPPLSLKEARQHRESITASAREQRKASINFIRSRTASRVEASNRPKLEDITGSDEKD